MRLRESRIEKEVCDHARKLGCLVYKFTSPGKRGVPDRMFILPLGTAVFIEFKAPGKKMTPLQERETFMLIQRGMRVMMCDNTDNGKRWIGERISDEGGGVIWD